jgi:murein DD-endopeptidase MepM/ murein hydrolase activator NlpD
MNTLRLYYPCKPLGINQRFGENQNAIYRNLGMKGHNGWDFYAPDGTPVRAAHEGTITYAGEDGSNGLLVVIRTDKEYDYKGGTAYYKTLYGHLKRGSLRVTAGQTVKTGDVIALADNTGASTGSHLHFGLKPVLPGEADWQWWNVEQSNGYNGAIDPAPFWTGLHAEDYWAEVNRLRALIERLLGYLKNGFVAR